jgi:hypothetical protein
MIIDFTEQQAKRLQETFPDRSDYITELRREQDGFTLKQIHSEHRAITASLNKNAQYVRVVITAGQQNQYQNELRAKLTADDELYLKSSDDRMLTRPERAAEWFIRKVCGIG